MSAKKPIFFVPEKRYYTHLLNVIDMMGQDDLITITDDPNILDDLEVFYFPITPYLGHLGNVSLLFDDWVWDMVRRPNARLFYDLSCEPITYEGYTSNEFLAFHKRMEEAGIPAEKIVFAIGNYQAVNYYQHWADSFGMTYRIQVVCLNFYFQYYWEMCLSKWFRDSYETMFANAYRTVMDHAQRSKYFMSLNMRPRTHRYAAMLHILERDFMDKGIISFLGEEFGSKDTPSVESMAETIDFIKALPESSERLLSVWNKLQTMAPIVLDRDAGSLRKDLWQRQVGEIDWMVPEAKVQGGIPVIDSYFELVNDTWFTGPSNLLVGEKLVRPLIRLQPFIFVGSPYLLRYMQEVGFKTFSPWIDESYDTIEDPALRMEAILREIDRLCACSIEEIHAMYCEMWPVLEHNFNHFISGMPSICRMELERNVMPYLEGAALPENYDVKQWIERKVTTAANVTQETYTPARTAAPLRIRISSRLSRYAAPITRRVIFLLTHPSYLPKAPLAALRLAKRVATRVALRVVLPKPQPVPEPILNVEPEVVVQAAAPIVAPIQKRYPEFRSNAAPAIAPIDSATVAQKAA